MAEDNLESYFKKHLSGESTESGDWNMPSDGVWDKVAPEIQTKRGIFIPWKYLYLIGFLLIAGIALVFWFVGLPSDSLHEKDIFSNNSTNQNATTIFPDSQQENTNPEIKENDTPQDINALESKPSEGSGIINTTGEPDKVVALSENGLQNEINRNSSEDASHLSLTNRVQNKKSEPYDVQAASFNSSASQTGVIGADKESDADPNNTINQSAGYITGKKKNFSETWPVQQIITLQPLNIDLIIASAESRPIVAVYSDDQLSDIQQSVKKPVSFNNKGKFGIGVFYAPTVNTTYLKGSPQDGLIETGNMYLYSGGWGLDLKYYLSKRITLVSGVGRTEIISWSKSMIDFGYDSSTEHNMGNGNKENTSDIPMQTPFGKINTEITYQFSENDVIPDGEMMNSELETHQEIKYLSIPLGIEYNIIPFTRFNWFTEGGIQYNRALKDATRFTSRILHHGHDMDVVEEQMTSHPVYTENYLNFYIGSGVNYQLSKTLQASGSFRYFGNITKVNLQDNMSTYVDGFSLKFSLIYLF